jgi:cytochrome c553
MWKVALTVFALAGIGSAVQAAGDPEAGKAKSATCAACHGADGNSLVATYPKLAGQHAGYIAKQLADYKSGARKHAIMSGMAAPLSDQDVQDLAAFYANQKAQVGTASQESLSLGQKIYRGGNPASRVAACMSCHGPAGSGNGPAQFPALSGQHAQYTADQLNQFKEGARANDPAAMMHTTASRMTSAEVNAVSEYLAGLH